MVSKKLMGFWAFFDVCLLAAGIIALIFSIVWRTPDLIRDLIVSTKDLNGGLAVGIGLLITWAFSVGAIIQPKHVTKPLVILNWVLIVDAIIVLVIGTILWFFSLRQRDEFHTIFAAQSDDTKILIQDALQCCGYFNATDLVVIGGSFCANQTFVETTNNATSNFCVTPITARSDYTLENTFSTIYGFMAIVILLFLATLCVVSERRKEERFRKIDEKRGGRGFV